MKDWEWTDRYTLGIPAIDLQHKRIFDCIARIARGATQDDSLCAEAEVVRLLHLLSQHFSLEEKMMREFHYPDLAGHIKEHREFHAAVGELALASLKKKGGVGREALRAIHEWWTRHIEESDKHYFDFFSNPIPVRRHAKCIVK